FSRDWSSDVCSSDLNLWPCSAEWRVDNLGPAPRGSVLVSFAYGAARGLRSRNRHPVDIKKRGELVEGYRVLSELGRGAASVIYLDRKSGGEGKSVDI